MSTAAPNSMPAWLRGGTCPRHVAAAVILGTLAGAVAGWNLTFALLIGLALLANGPALTTLTAGLIGFTAAHIGANLTTALGSFLLEKVGLAAVIESLGHAPLTALFGLHDFQTLGGAALAAVLSLPAAHAMTRRCAAPDAEDETAPPPASLLRPWGCTAAFCWTAAVVATLHVAAPQRVGQALLVQLSAAAQAPVTAERVHYDVFTGTLHLTGLRIRDLDEPGRVALRINDVTAWVDPGLLLRGRLHADEMKLSGLTYDAVSRSTAPRKLFADEQATILREIGTPEAAPLDPTQPIDVVGFLRNWNETTARLTAFSRLITLVESVGDLEAAHAGVAQRVQAVRRPAIEPRDAITGRSLPLVQVKALHIEGLPAGWSLGEAARVELLHLTSRPTTSPRSVQLTLDAPARNTQLAVNFRLSSAERRHELTVQCDSCAAGDLIDLQHAAGAGLETAPAPTLALRGLGTVGRDRLEMSLACDVVGFRPAATAPRFGNLDAAVWRAGIDRLGGLRLDATLTGRWNEPRVQITPAAAVDQLKHQLRSVGEHLLVKAVEAGRFPTSPVAAPAAVAETKPSEAKPSETKSAAKTNEVAKKSDDATPAAAAKAVAAATSATETKPGDTKATEPGPTETAKPATPPTAPKPLASSTGTAAAPLAATNVAKPATTATPIASAVANTSPTATLTTAAGPASSTTPPIVTPSLPTAPTVTLPSTTPTQPVAAATNTSITELRQPAGVLDPSARPGLVNWKTGQADMSASTTVRPRSDVRPTPTAANKIIGVTPKVAPPVEAAPRASAEVTHHDALPRPDAKNAKSSLMTRWFGAEASTTTSDVPTPPAPPANIVRNQPPASTPTAKAPAQPRDERPFVDEPAPTTAAKPLFPRLRKFLGTDDDELFLEPETLAASPPSERGKSTTPAEPPASRSPTPQTAKEPWYDRMFR